RLRRLLHRTVGGSVEKPPCRDHGARESQHTDGHAHGKPPAAAVTTAAAVSAFLGCPVRVHVVHRPSALSSVLLVVRSCCCSRPGVKRPSPLSPGPAAGRRRLGRTESVVHAFGRRFSCILF